MTHKDGTSGVALPVERLLIREGKVTDDQLERARQSSLRTGRTVTDELQALGLIGVEELAHAIAKLLGMRSTEAIDANAIPRELIERVPYAFVKRHNALPIGRSGRRVQVAVCDPLNLTACEELRLLLAADIEGIYCPQTILSGAIESCYQRADEAPSQLVASLNRDGGDETPDGVEAYDLLDDREQAPIVRLLHALFLEAIQQGASDIHFEPGEQGLRVRYRIDGVLQNRCTPPAEAQAQLLTRIKVMAKLDIAERRLPQDGRIKLLIGGRAVDVRVSTVPVAHGERIVLRLLDQQTLLVGLDQLGMDPEMLSRFRSLIEYPEGILLVTGPTGSGKTTTLYSALSELNCDQVNIMTIEDPVEYKLPGIAQMQVRPKIDLTFAAGLRHILRQDPDVVMVGEVRDRETAEIAVQASLTGHLVLTTLHTNDAPSALTRLVDMGIEPYLISSSLIGVLAQRLVRTICPRCREVYNPSEAELLELGIPAHELPHGGLMRGTGCNYCFGSGYKGRRGLYELMLVDQEIKRQLLQTPDAVALRQLALRRGMQGLRARGAKLVAEGVTTLAEILRVTRATGVEE
jgi:general secretion pathway protein E